MNQVPPISSHGSDISARAQRHPSISILEVAGAFLRLGCLSFGGPIAHLGYFRAEFVEKRKWLDDARYGDLVALCQFLPGPASSQVAFALGMQRAGILGALLASFCFTLPSALLMIAFAHGLASASAADSAGYLLGLKLVALPVVAQAVWHMGQKLCLDRARISLCIASALALLAFPGAATQMILIAFGGIAGFVWYRRTIFVGVVSPKDGRNRGHAAAIASLAMFLSLLLLLPLLASTSKSHQLALFDSFYRSGAVVFGGGHVVLPLLRAELVPPGWLSDSQFLAGYGAAQALPGPLFAFSAYLGAVMSSGPAAWLQGFLCLLAIFLPAWLLIGGVLPFWQRLRDKPGAQAALAGANATVVGILLAALYTPIFTENVHGPREFALALLAFALLEHWKLPPWLVVTASAGAGGWLLSG